MNIVLSIPLLGARDVLQTIQTLSSFYKNGEDFSFQQMWDEGVATTDPNLKQAIQQFQSRPDWQSILDSGKKDGWVSHKNADAFWDMAGDPKEMNEGFPEISPTKQGGIGDCFFMSSLTAISNSPSGKEKIGNMIQPVWLDNNRQDLGYGYLVKFPGDPLQKTYQMTRGEVDDGSQFSSGDHTTRVLEVAADKLRKEQDNKNLDWGGIDSQALTLLTGLASTSLSIDYGVDEVTKNSRKDYARNVLMDIAAKHPNNDFIMTFDDKVRQKFWGIVVSDGWHSLTVTKLDMIKFEVTFCNPWDSREQETVSLETFLERADGISYISDDASPATSSLPS